MILVNGATGMVGSFVVTELLARGAQFRVFVRDPKKVAHLPAAVERAIGTFEDLASVRASMRGATRMFHLSPEFEAAHLDAVIAIAKEEGVKQIVKLSTLEALEEKHGLARWHRAEEKLIEASGLAFTFVRPGNFASNTLHWAHAIRATGNVYAPTGDGKTAPIHPRDIGAVISAALSEDGHEGNAYRLTGPELLDAKEQTAILSAAIGKPLACIDTPIEKAAAQMLGRGASKELVSALVELWTGIRAGEGAVVTSTVEDVLHRPALTFARWAHENAHAFA